MKNCKRGITIAFCGLSLMIRPADAFVTFDFTETPGTFTQITEAMENLAQAKAQMTEMMNSLKAIGDSCMSITQFAPNFDSIADGLLAANTTADTLNSSLETQVAVQDKLDKTLNSIDGAQKRTAEALVNQIEKGMKLASVDVSNKIILAENQMSSQYIEEEEEESVDVAELEKNLSDMFENIQKDNNELSIGLNDVFDETINIMNKGSDLNDKVLENLSTKILVLEKEINKEKQEYFLGRLNELKTREQKVSDWGISIAEDAKDRYNRQYQEKIVDGINNYKKTVFAYVEGSISKEDVLGAGAMLKELTASFENYADAKQLDSYKTEVTAVRQEAEKLAQDITDYLKTKKEKS